MLEKPFVWTTSSVEEALLHAACAQQLQVLMNYVTPIEKEWGMHHGVINSPAVARFLANNIMNYTGS